MAYRVIGGWSGYALWLLFLAPPCLAPLLGLTFRVAGNSAIVIVFIACSTTESQPHYFPSTHLLYENIAALHCRNTDHRASWKLCY